MSRIIYRLPIKIVVEVISNYLVRELVCIPGEN